MAAGWRTIGAARLQVLVRVVSIANRALCVRVIRGGALLGRPVSAQCVAQASRDLTDPGICHFAEFGSALRVPDPFVVPVISHRRFMVPAITQGLGSIRRYAGLSSVGPNERFRVSGSHYWSS